MGRQSFLHPCRPCIFFCGSVFVVFPSSIALRGVPRGALPLSPSTLILCRLSIGRRRRTVPKKRICSEGLTHPPLKKKTNVANPSYLHILLGRTSVEQNMSAENPRQQTKDLFLAKKIAKKSQLSFLFPLVYPHFCPAAAAAAAAAVCR